MAEIRDVFPMPVGPARRTLSFPSDLPASEKGRRRGTVRLGITNCGPGLPRSPVTGLRRGEAPGDSSGKLPDMLWGSSESDTLDDMAGDDGTLMAEPGPKTPVKTGVMGCERP